MGDNTVIRDKKETNKKGSNHNAAPLHPACPDYSGGKKPHREVLVDSVLGRGNHETLGTLQYSVLHVPPYRRKPLLPIQARCMRLTLGLLRVAEKGASFTSSIKEIKTQAACMWN